MPMRRSGFCGVPAVGSTVGDWTAVGGGCSRADSGGAGAAGAGDAGVTGVGDAGAAGAAGGAAGAAEALSGAGSDGASGTAGAAAADPDKLAMPTSSLGEAFVASLGADSSSALSALGAGGLWRGFGG
jgi:hypothetical protein